MVVSDITKSNLSYKLPLSQEVNTIKSFTGHLGVWKVYEDLHDFQTEKANKLDWICSILLPSSRCRSQNRLIWLFRPRWPPTGLKPQKPKVNRQIEISRPADKETARWQIHLSAESMARPRTDPWRQTNPRADRNLPSTTHARLLLHNSASLQRDHKVQATYAYLHPF